MKEYVIKYGDRDLKFQLPGANVIWEADIGLARQEITDAMIAAAIRRPIGGKTLTELIRDEGRRKIVILVDDGTRITPQQRILPLLVEALREAGAALEEVTILIALGSHRPMNRAECIARYGQGIVDTIKIVNHNYDDPEQLVDLETTSSGIPIRVNRLYYESELSIAVGTIVPHLYAGWSGGCKMIQPGVCGKETTAMTHLLAARNCREILGNIDNPVRREIDEVGIRSGLRFIVNTVIDAEGQVAGVVAGDPLQAHRAGVKIAEELSCYAIPEPAEIVIATSHPADRDFWQANKGFNAIPAGIKPGGTLIFVSPCPEGNAPDHPLFCQMGTTPLPEVEAGLKEGRYPDGIGIATYIAMAKAREGMNTIMVSEGMDAIESRRMGFDWAPDLESAIRAARTRHGETATIGIVHHSADIILRVNHH